ncbi:WD40-repeat-containing domain protein [Phascolomyces articulosus]|uniref:WD40-repeat-containing domain protein n=1 Tax=Phascolomyces articulosus TaxID=60185 RepID=A0AAD5K7T8_9FUNG|nr:WD40-repeat-containing domain protein [Phascolomyces articulosus]
MTLLYASSTKLFSFLLSSSSSNKAKNNYYPISSDKTTVHIAIIPHKDGTKASIKCLNPIEPRSSSSSTTSTCKKPRLSSFLKFSGASTVLYNNKRNQQRSNNSSNSSNNDNNSNAASTCTLTTTNSSNTIIILSDHFQRLPPELIQKLFFHLDAISIGKLAQTCQRLHMICNDDHGVWRTLFVKHFNNYLFTSTMINHRQQLVQQKVPSLLSSPSWYSLYRNHYILERRWQRGQANVRYLTGHTDSVYCIVRYRKQYIVSGSRDHSVKLWDLDNYMCVASETHHEGSVLCLKIASDDEWMVSGSSDGTCVLWKLSGGNTKGNKLQPLSRLRGHTSGVLDVCIVENKYIVTASRDATVRVWDRYSAKELRRLEGHAGPVNALQAHGHHVVSASGDSKVKLWNAETGECLRTFDGHTRGLACARFDGMRIYSGGQDAVLRVWNAQTGQCSAILEGHDQLVRTVDCYGDRAVTGSYDRTIKLWDSVSGQCLLSFQGGHDSWVFNVLLSRTRIISAGQDKRIMILDFGNDLNLAY